MAVAIDFETHDDLQRQLAQCEVDGARMAAEIVQLRAGYLRELSAANEMRAALKAVKREFDSGRINSKLGEIVNAALTAVPL